MHAYDPVAINEGRRFMNGWAGMQFAPSAQAATEGADALIVVTEWKEFRSPDLGALRKGLKQPVVFDGRNMLDPAFAAGEGIEYHGIGRLGGASTS